MTSRPFVLLTFCLVLILGACTPPVQTSLPSTEFVEPTAGVTQASSPAQEPPTQEPGRPALAIHTIHMFNENSGWALGQVEPFQDLVLVTVDGGNSWEDVSPPESPSPGGSMQADAAFIDQNLAWVVYSGSSNVWSTADGGATWNPAPAVPSGILGARFFALDDQNGWLLRSLEAGMSQIWEALFATSNGGDSWIKLVDPYDTDNFARFSKTGWDFYDSQTGWMTHNSSGVSASVYFQGTADGGVTWENIVLSAPPDQPDLFDQAMCHTHSPKLYSPTDGLIAVSCSTVEPQAGYHYLYKTEDGGITWSIQDYSGGELHYLPDETIFAAGMELARSSDRGITWEMQAPLTEEAKFSFVSSEIVFAAAHVNDTYHLHFSKDGGASWTLLEPALTGAAAPASEEFTPAASAEFAFLSYRANPEQFECSDIYLASLTDTQPIRLTDSSSCINSFDWDPTGNMIVLSSDLDGDQELFLLTLDGSGWLQLTNNEVPDTLPVFSPDGHLIAYSHGTRGSEEILLMDLAMQASRSLTEGSTPVWNPDGSSLLVFREFDGLYEFNLETEEENLLVDSSENGMDYHVSFSPSESLLLAASNRHSPGDYLVEAPYLFEADGSLIGRVGTVWGTPPYAWLPDGSGILAAVDFLMLAELKLLDLNGELHTLPLEDPSGWFPRFRPGS